MCSGLLFRWGRSSHIRSVLDELFVGLGVIGLG